MTIPSLKIGNKSISHACVLQHPDCCGVWSWHNNESDAQHNADELGGTVVPVDWVDGELITPSLAVQAIKKFARTPL